MPCPFLLTADQLMMYALRLHSPLHQQPSASPTPHANISIHNSTVSSFILTTCSADLELPYKIRAHSTSCPTTTRHHAIQALPNYFHSSTLHCICRNKLSKGDIHHPKTDIISASGLISSLYNELRRLWFRAPLNTPSLRL